MPQIKRRFSKARARSTRLRGRRSKTARPVRLYVVEDHVNFIEALRTSPELPAHNVKLVGASTRNFLDLPRRVIRAKPDIVLIDINLGPARTVREVELGSPLQNGLAACEAVKRANAGIRVLVWSYWGQQAKQQAIDAGADHYEEQTVPLSTLLQTIKRVARNQPVMTTASATTIGRIVSIRLMTRDRRLTVEDAADRAVTVKLKPVSFALLWYLGLERLTGASGWLKPDYPDRNLVYRFEKPNVWRHICASAGVSRHDTVVPNTILNNWKTSVRDSLKAYGRIQLFGSNPGRPTGPPQCSLVPSIRQTAIEVDDPDSVTQALGEAAAERAVR
jgi:DNA-binding NarL/FixJ family response regulator